MIILLLGVQLVARESRQFRAVERHPHVSSAARPVEEGDFAHMLLDDLLDDREPKPRAPHPRCHIGFGQPLAILRKTHAGIKDIDDQVRAILVQPNINAIAGDAVLATISPSFNSFHAVLDDVRKSLRKLASIADHSEFALWRLKRETDRRMSHFVKE